MNGGAIAKKGFRYQDLCAMYFALNSFKLDSTFEHIFCEQGKIDFEIWNADSFSGFQVKLNPKNLKAKDNNKIFLYYLSRAELSGKEKKNFWFIFSKQPINSIDKLFSTIRNGQRGVKYDKRTKKYIDTALDGVPMESFSISFRHLENEQVEQSVFAISADLLKQKLNTSEDIPTEVVRSFMSRLRDEVDKISCKSKEEERVYTAIEISKLIETFLVGVNIVKYERRGNIAKKIEIKLPNNITEDYEIRTQVIKLKASISAKKTTNEDNSIKD